MATIQFNALQLELKLIGAYALFFVILLSFELIEYTHCFNLQCQFIHTAASSSYFT